MEREEYLREERLINESKNMKEMLLRDIVREAERDIRATLREVESKYLGQVDNVYRVYRKLLKERRERDRRRR